MAFFVLSPASEPELALLADIERAAATMFPPGRLPDPGQVMPLEHLQASWRSGLLQVARVDETVVGFAAVWLNQQDLHLAELAVRPAFARRGIGRSLVAWTQQEAVRRERAAVTLTTFADLPWNAPFYTRLGFRILPASKLNPLLRTILREEARMGLQHRVGMQWRVPRAGNAPLPQPGTTR